MVHKLPVVDLPPNVSLRLLWSYLSFGQLERARDLFDRIPHPDLRSLTILISAFTKNNLPKESIRFYRRLRENKRLEPDRLVLLSVAKACANSSDLVEAKWVHEEAVKFGFSSDLVLGNALIDMYGKCGFHDGARRVFDDLPQKDVVSWTSLISACMSCRMPVEALSLSQARIVFDTIPYKDTVSWIVMLAAYFVDGECEEALKLFELMRSGGVALSPASWNCMISGLAQNGRPEEAFRMLGQMQQLGFKPNHITVVSALPACSYIESLRRGREIHGYIFRHQILEGMVPLTALVLMYAKCGALDNAREVFNHMPRKDTVAWNTMILANSMHGCGEDALAVFHQMLECGVKPNSVTFIVVLTGCSHSQLVDVGKSIFNSMSTQHGLQPDADHYACMADVLCRAGHLEEAYGFIQSMPMQPTVGAWDCSSTSFEIEPENPGNYVLLSNILVAAKLWDDASSIRMLMRDKMRDRGVTKVPGRSWVQIRNKVYTFVKDDDRNALRDEIYGFLKEIREKMRLDGYLPDTDYVLQDVNKEEKEELLCSHSEKLAVAFGILNLKGESVIRVFKNLRICGDCHSAIKFMAKIIGVQIIVRDNVRFHHFRNGWSGSTRPSISGPADIVHMSLTELVASPSPLPRCGRSVEHVFSSLLLSNHACLPGFRSLNPSDRVESNGAAAAVSRPRPAGRFRGLRCEPIAVDVVCDGKNPLAAVLELPRTLWRQTMQPLRNFGFGRRSVWEGAVGLFMLQSGAVCPCHRLGGVPVLPGVRYLCRHSRADPRGECGQCRAGRFHCEEHRRRSLRLLVGSRVKRFLSHLLFAVLRDRRRFREADWIDANDAARLRQNQLSPR
ncbi:Pentatricopeptide repeat-containing protein [Musa troglodytarum]|uniref:Pentatricopeptide repeat-containing protein n=1 Tax=Musa troglodytarum TaxID=320322 RepID=A0A9E7L353_9LILI|nr:Pentatricopeptide repeat-containing protein [Musa troglodytarum]